MSQERTIGLNHQISEEAAQWLVEFRTGPVSTSVRKEFDAWVRASPEHLRAFIEMALLWRESGALDPQRRFDVEELIARDRSDSKLVELTSHRASSEGAVPLSRSGRDVLPRAIRTERREARRPVRWLSRAGWLAAAASLFGALVGGSLLVEQILSGRTYSTDVGERRSVNLPDGSTVLLDSRSSLRVAFTATTRQVELVHGQALFSVVHDPQKPFLVRAGATVIRDIGTQFDVKQRPDDTVVTVVEGRVAVLARPPGAPPAVTSQSSNASSDYRDEPVFVSAGEQVDVAAGNFSPQLVHVSVGSVVAWTRDQVVLESATLTEAAREFNLYSNRKIVAEDRGASPLRLSGVFVTNPDFLLRYLRERPDIAITETDSEIDIIRKPGK
ncbi:MAG: FecR domain-containing protein [Steroidobacteraceae bacterium]